MTLLAVIAILICAGVIVTMLKRYGGRLIDEPFLSWIVYLIIIAVIVWLLAILGVFELFRNIPMPSFSRK